MDLKTKAKKLISRSLFLSAQKRAFLTALVEGMTPEQVQQLIKILETEPQAIATILKNNLSDDSSGEFLKKFEQFDRQNRKDLVSDLKTRHVNKEAKELEDIENEIDNL